MILIRVISARSRQSQGRVTPGEGSAVRAPLKPGLMLSDVEMLDHHPSQPSLIWCIYFGKCTEGDAGFFICGTYVSRLTRIAGVSDPELLSWRCDVKAIDHGPCGGPDRGG